ncbi:FAD-dependent oxidoreductase [Desulfofundulus thermobenzoicus]|uniref:FAD-dependent oxidoreductase n=1 Tax=Desulfofundulus thermobenzoicus TaxID=29376 RepID=A0A6N7IPQ7_9FIRM|nr:FAD-binding oxidoreductase [Desulfofundulus thermobenzoicus]MQL51960.1 FAD-dependent oxidoreductase [Desulfofundulus thermobenzoicus]HHW42681.1 FAD-binding oxidoreductase [Desulfotomaculum sp.]
MALTADVVIIGGGLMGCSTAYHLAGRGAGRVVVVEKSTLGAGSSGRSSAILRCHYTHSELARMALKSLEIWQHFPEIIGGECGYTRTGYVVLVGPDNLETLRRNVAMHRELGIKVEMIDLEEVAKMVPGINLEDVAGAAFEPESGYADPGLTLTSLVQRGRELGVQYRQMTPVVGILHAGGRVQGVRTPAEDIAAPVVIDCAGSWAGRVAALAELDLPVQAHREQIVVLERPGDFPGEHPVLSDLLLLQYLRSETGDLTLVGNSDQSEVEVVDPDCYNEEVDLETVEDVLDRVVRRLPRLGEGSLRRGYSGCYEVTPDYQAFIGPVPGLEGFYVNAGYSGHGFKFTPLAGQAMAEIILDGEARVYDAGLFRVTRFAEDQPVVGVHLYSRGQQLR